MRYARQDVRPCDECTRLAAESAALFQQYLDAKDALTLTSKNDPARLERRKHLDRVSGQLREARRRSNLHEETHHDEFSN